MYVRMRMHACVYIYVCVYERVCVCVYVWMYVCACVYVCMYVLGCALFKKMKTVEKIVVSREDLKVITLGSSQRQAFHNYTHNINMPTSVAARCKA
jgi:hypothetical protein